MNRDAMNRRHEELVREFSVSFGVHVRDDGEGGLLDERDDRAREMAARSAEDLADMMGEVPQDLAAMISRGIDCVRESLVNRIMFLHAGRLATALGQMRRSDTLPLQAKDWHPVAGLLDRLLETNAGCALYRDMAVILLGASREESPSTLSFNVVSAVHAEERSVPHSDEEVEGGDRVQ